MNEHIDPDVKQQEREQIVELGSDITKSGKGNIYTLTIIGQVEGHQVLPENCKTRNTSTFCRCWPVLRKAMRLTDFCFC